MIDLMMAGGIPMIMVLLMGLASLGGSAYFMYLPSQRAQAFVRAFSAGTVFAILAGTSADLGMVMTRVTQTPEWAQSPDLHLIVMTGFGESLSVPILGFTLLTLTWMLMGLGARRVL